MDDNTVRLHTIVDAGDGATTEVCAEPYYSVGIHSAIWEAANEGGVIAVSNALEKSTTIATVRLGGQFLLKPEAIWLTYKFSTRNNVGW